jgi:hypothetical protein
MRMRLGYFILPERVCRDDQDKDMRYDRGMAQDELLPTDIVPEIAEPTEPAVAPPESAFPPLPSTTKRSPLIKILMIAGGLILLVVVLGLILGNRKGSPTTTETTPSPSTSTEVARYSEDPDSYRVASFIESKLKGFDPAVSELDHCFNTKCDSVNTEAIKRIPRNVMILLDSSGSMQQKVGDNTKMDSAKIAIREYLQKASSLEMTKVGLIVYGQRQQLYCRQSGKLVVAPRSKPLEDFNLDTDDQILRLSNQSGGPL